MPEHRPLLHVGLQKTGTTWLQRHGFAAVADFNVLTYSKATRVIRQIGTYLDGSLDCGRDGIRQAVDESPATPVISFEGISNPWGWTVSRQRTRAQKLKDLLPEARVLLVIREQTLMLSSLYAQYVKEGGYAPFSVFAEGGAPNAQFSKEWLKYHHHFDAYQSTFGRSNVMVLPYEVLRSDAQRFLETVATFAGVEYQHVPINNRRENPTPSRSALRALRMVNRLIRKSAMNPQPLLYTEPRANYARMIAQKLPTPSAARLLSRRNLALATRLVRECADSNYRLCRETDLDLGRWGYELGIGAGMRTERCPGDRAGRAHATNRS